MSAEPINLDLIEASAKAAREEWLTSDYFGHGRVSWYEGVAGGLGGDVGVLSGRMSPEVVLAIVAEVQELRELQSRKTNLVEVTSGLAKTAARLTAESESLTSRCNAVASENEGLKNDVEGLEVDLAAVRTESAELNRKWQAAEAKLAKVKEKAAELRCTANTWRLQGPERTIADNLDRIIEGGA
ncbi:hypothetical protein P3H15_32670 [Rhodococcus sp. T2V]|uniref:hypothetical protein n=1 Tax=Rhodococcus sp. T2V TaxID=3034164 RepID=UPI0023E33D23|nr:hypothetical protein [Rhodococcus sp. T2V]MDF3309774.1 hypothetical protein [Rhodococcus sp. T2V]